MFDRHDDCQRLCGSAVGNIVFQFSHSFTNRSGIVLFSIDFYQHQVWHYTYIICVCCVCFQYRYFDFDPACAVGAAGARDSDFHLFSIENDIDKYRVAVESNSVSVVPDQQPSPSAPVSTPSYPFPTPSKAVSVPSSALPASVNKAVVINTQTAETASSGSWGDWASSLLSKATGK
jgi:hypothetical protein